MKSFPFFFSLFFVYVCAWGFACYDSLDNKSQKQYLLVVYCLLKYALRNQCGEKKPFSEEWRLLK